MRLREVLPPVLDTELRRDLWGPMLQKLDESSYHTRPSWLDWALIASLVLALFAFPEVFPILLYWL